MLSTLVIRGGLKNTGSDCYSLWAKLDTGSAPAVRAATQCGPGVTSVNLRSAPSMSPNGTLSLCRGEGTLDCGQWLSAREFPAAALPTG